MSSKLALAVILTVFLRPEAACTNDALTKQEETFLRLLPAAVNYSVNGTQLQIVTVDGGAMNYTSIPPQAPQGPTAVISGPLTFGAAVATPYTEPSVSQ